MPWRGQFAHARDIQLALTNANGLDEDSVHTKGVEHIADLASRRRQPTYGTSGGKRADVDTRIERHILHPDSVAEQRTARKGRSGINGDDPHRESLGAIVSCEMGRERALASSRRTGDASPPGASQFGMPRSEQPLEPVAVVLDDADGARKRRRPAVGEISKK